MAILLNGSTNTISPSSNALKFTAISASEYINALGNTGATPTINLALGNFITATLSANVSSWTFSNVPSQAVGFTLVLTNDATAGRSITWNLTSGTIIWPGGTAGPLGRTTTANKTDIYTFLTTDSGTTWYANLAQANF